MPVCAASQREFVRVPSAGRLNSYMTSFATCMKRKVKDMDNLRYERAFTLLSSFYLGAVGLNTKDMLTLTGQSYAARVLVTASGIAFILALSSCLIAIKMRKYEGPSYPTA